MRKSQKFSVIGLAFLLLARQSLYKYNSVLTRSSVPFYFRFFRYKKYPRANHFEIQISAISAIWLPLKRRPLVLRDLNYHYLRD